MIKASDLQKVDYAILQYLHKHGKTEVSELAKALNKSPKIIELRVDLLATPDRNNRIPVENTSYIDREYRDIVVDGGIDSWEYTGFITINALGEKALEDSKLAKQDDRKQYLIRSVLIPFAVSLVTAALTTISTLYITKWLAPYLLP